MTVAQAKAALSVSLSGPLRDVSAQVAQDLRDRLRTYPPPPPRARRTGRLGEGWQIQTTTRGAAVVNVVPYAPLIQSATRQTRAAKAIGWTTDFQAVQDVLSGNGVAQAVKAALNKAFRR